MEKKYSHNPAMFKNSPVAFVLAVAAIPLFGLGILLLLWWYLSCKTVKLEVVGNDVVLEEGLLSKRRTEVSMARIRTVQVYQSLLNRMFGVGKISIFTAGDQAEIEASGMPNPHSFRDLIKP